MCQKAPPNRSQYDKITFLHRIISSVKHKICHRIISDRMRTLPTHQAARPPTGSARAGRGAGARGRRSRRIDRHDRAFEADGEHVPVIRQRHLGRPVLEPRPVAPDAREDVLAGLRMRPHRPRRGEQRAGRSGPPVRAVGDSREGARDYRPGLPADGRDLPRRGRPRRCSSEHDVDRCGCPNDRRRAVMAADRESTGMRTPVPRAGHVFPFWIPLRKWCGGVLGEVFGR